MPEYAGTVAQWLFEPAKRNALMDIFLNRDYTQYDQIKGGTHKPDNWPLAEDFRLYVKKDVAPLIWTEAVGVVQPVTATVVDPYAEGWRDVAAVQVIGSGVGAGQGQFQSPQGVAVGADGSIYVADSMNHRIQKFDKDGQFAASFGGTTDGNLPGQFKEPWAVAVAPDQSIYVADTWNHRVQHLDPDGAAIKTWGAEGNTNGQAEGNEGVFFGPRGIATGQDGRVFVADTGNKRIQIFDDAGTFVSQFGGSGLQPGQLDEPVGIATDAQGNIVVADTWNGRVQLFNPQGQPLNNWEIDGWLDKDKVGKPYLAVDGKSRVYVADQVGRRILVFNESGKYLGGFGQYGNDTNGFGLPSGIAVDKEGYVYVVDTVFGRVLKYPPFEPAAVKEVP